MCIRDRLSADADGYAVMRIRIAGIPDNAVGLYLYYSFDQVSYEMAAWTGKDGEYTNYLEQNAASGQAYDYIVFKYNIGNRPIWFKTQLKVRAVSYTHLDVYKRQILHQDGL